MMGNRGKGGKESDSRTRTALPEFRTAELRGWCRARDLFLQLTLLPGGVLLFLLVLTVYLHVSPYGGGRGPTSAEVRLATPPLSAMMASDPTVHRVVLDSLVACGVLLLIAGLLHLLIRSRIALYLRPRDDGGQVQGAVATEFAKQAEGSERAEVDASPQPGGQTGAGIEGPSESAEESDPYLALPWWRAEFSGAHAVMWVILALEGGRLAGWWPAGAGLAYYLDWLAGGAFAIKFCVPALLIVIGLRVSDPDGGEGVIAEWLHYYHRFWSIPLFPAAIAIGAPLICAWLCR